MYHFGHSKISSIIINASVTTLTISSLKQIIYLFLPIEFITLNYIMNHFDNMSMHITI